MRPSRRLSGILTILITAILATGDGDARSNELLQSQAGLYRLNIGMWNIQNFSSQPGYSAMEERGTRRSSIEIAEIRSIIRTSGVDYWLLQEVTDITSISYLAEGQFNYFLSSDSALLKRRNSPAIYTGFLIDWHSEAKLIDAFELGVVTQYRDRSEPEALFFTRPGQAIALLVGGIRILLINIHLKSGCSRILNPEASVQQSCFVNTMELRNITRVIDTLFHQYDLFIVAGDFNRAYDLTEGHDLTYKSLLYTLKGSSDAWEPVRIPSDVVSCKLRRDEGLQQIEFFILGGRGLGSVLGKTLTTIEPELRQGGNASALSDHCAFILSLDLR